MLSQIREMLAHLIAYLVLGRKLLWMLTMRPRAFGALRQIAEDVLMQMFTYRQGLLTPPAGVAQQRLIVVVGDAEPVEITVGAEADAVDFKAGPVGVTVKLSLDYLDAAGNDSANLTHEFVVEDKIAPAAPEGFGDLSQIAEE
jgi:hypothetical protein